MIESTRELNYDNETKAKSSNRMSSVQIGSTPDVDG